MRSGRLFYIIGASGCGKDSLIRYARERLADHSGVVFAHRYITRPPAAVGENHVALTENEFEARAASGLFAMHWRSHGLRYGIGKEVNFWLTEGLSVVVNGSRSYLEEARRNYPELIAVIINVAAETLAVRLSQRGRETAEQMSERLALAEAFAPPLGQFEIIENNGALHEAGERLLGLLSAAAATPAVTG